MPSTDPRLMTVFADALERNDPVARAAYLDGACRGDAGLRRLVDELLAAHGGAGRFLEPGAPEVPESSPAATLARSGEAPAPSPSGSGSITAAHDPEGPGTPPASVRLADGAEGTLIAGRYKLLQQIGEGGMGTVWMADQTEPVKRRVAVKLIRVQQGGSRTILARFEAERQAIALMDHPHIAKLLDAGSTPEGAPFFVMELVKGIPLNEYCDEHKLGIRERLQLFTQVCSAVQHAHQKGIIHRDLKPSNILVENHDGKPVPKVIDFGLAKATSAMQLSEHTLFTAFGSVMGTPMYMAPEQANFNAVDVDTRADVYALGVVLYELLTGTTPITRESMKKAALDEMLRLIREQEAPTPSSRLSGVDTVPSVAANRRMEPRNLGRFVRGELDWIVMKALSKERDRRYETATGFARDVERFLNNEAVAAGPPSATYRLRKFARRNRGRVVAAGLVLLALLAGMAGTLWGLVRAERANARLLAKNAELDAERVKVHARFDTAMHAIETFHTGVSEDALLKNPQFKDLRTKLLREAAGFYAELERLLVGQADAKSRKSLAAGYSQLANLTAKIGDPQESLAVHRKALAVRRELAAEPGADVETRLDVAVSLLSLCLLHNGMGHVAEARRAGEEARAIAERLLPLAPTDPARVMPARAFFESAAPGETIPTADAVLTVLANAHHLIGVVFGMTESSPEEGLDSFRKALAIYRKLVDADPHNDDYRFCLAGTHSCIGNIARQVGKSAEAIESYRKALNIMRKLADADPANAGAQDDLAGTYHNISTAFLDAGRPEEALGPLRDGLAVRQKLVDVVPAATSYQKSLAYDRGTFANALMSTGKTAEGMEEFRKALSIYQKLEREFPLSPDVASGMGAVLHNIAGNHLDASRFAQAYALFREAAESQRRALAVNPAHPRYRQLLDDHLSALIMAAKKLGDSEGLAVAERELVAFRESDPAIVALDARLAAIIKGDQRPRDEAERLAIAQRAYDKGLYATAARLWGEALAADPKLAADRQAGHRYNAACAAALVASGQGKDDPATDEASRAGFRKQALGWLEAELSTWKRVSMTIEPGNKEAVVRTLTHWKGDADLAGIRDDAALAKLPEQERAAFKRLWTDADALLTRMEGHK